MSACPHCHAATAALCQLLVAMQIVAMQSAGQLLLHMSMSGGSVHLLHARMALQAYNGERRVVGVKSREVVLNAGKPWQSNATDA